MASRTVRAAHAAAAGVVASRFLQQRLATVARAVAAVATGNPRAEAVHRLRISARRATATITAFQPFVPRRQRRWFKKSLRRIRRAAGEARDLDVLTSRCRAAAAARQSAAAGVARQRLAEMLAKKRPQTRRGLEDEITRVQGCGWKKQTAALLVAVESAAMTETIDSYAHRRSRRLVRRFLTHLDHSLQTIIGVNERPLTHGQTMCFHQNFSLRAIIDDSASPKHKVYACASASHSH